jgi:cell division protein FtsQ
LVNFIEDSNEWRNKIVNISIDTTGNLTLIPRKGNEKFLFGQPDGIEQKMERMKLYYSSIIPARDSSRYTTVNVKYSGQIICK